MRGYYFDDGPTPDMLNVYVLVQPLYVPNDSVVFTTGQEIASQEVVSDREEETMDAVVRAMKYHERHIERLHDAASLIRDEWVVPRYQPAYGPHERRISAYSQIVSGDYQGGLTNLRSLRGHLAQQMSECSPPPWLGEMDAEAASLEDALRESPTRALALLGVWTQQTKANLKLQ
jgi:hypothetical protein